VSIKAEIENQVRRRQRGMKIRKDDQFWRGLSLVLVLSNEGGTITAQDVSSGRKSKMSFKDFTGQALIRVPRVARFVGSVIDQAWAVVGNSTLASSFRIRTAREYARSADSSSDREQISSWIFALRQGKEPRK